jgi:hypothetical protein
MIRAAKNGCSSEITFKGKKVYHDWENSTIPKSHLGKKLNKPEFLKKILNDEIHLPMVEKLMIDWEIYENGWYIKSFYTGQKEQHLFYYLVQFVYNRPKELEYFKQKFLLEIIK